MENLILIVSGPSGAGKSTLLKELPEEEFYFSISHTTRVPRPGEVDGRDYYFISRETFLEMLKRGDFLEWIEVHSNLYGTAKTEIDKAFSQGKHLVFDVEVIGAGNLKKYFGPLVVSIFIAPPNLKILEDRLRKRGAETEEKLQERLKRSSFELSLAPFFDYIVVNDDLAEAKKRFLSIIRAELCRPYRVKPSF
ncbi:guanylate kinase [Caldimicrobium thiodismutans]|uniref:Guanylate kinase n=1 Tax=Caldimicrobium thiodismutans TaxID=1653476 RepID=A0A0U5B3X5_9BACT|nr:guanylate kinase [Caldimicrobium thiodismutans]BAU22736.1 guanylate kinase [Caldimicrobium thiodismutans]